MHNTHSEKVVCKKRISKIILCKKRIRQFLRERLDGLQTFCLVSLPYFFEDKV